MNQSYLHRKNSRSLFLLIIIGLFTLLLTSVVALANENKVTVLATNLNVRYGPGLSHEILTQVQEEDQLNILGEDNEWYKVRLDTDQIGWVASWLVENEEVSLENQLFGRITAPEVNVRQFSTASSNALGTVTQGQEFPILYRENDWVQILFNQQVAWIHSDLIEDIGQPVQTAQTPAADDSVRIRIGSTPINIRTQPSTESDVLTTLRTEEEFDVISEENDWYQIELTNGSRGFVASWIAETIRGDSVSAEETSPPASDSEASHYATTLAEATIVIDPGHGGYDPGAVATSGGFTEKEITLSTALMLANRLENAGANVILTRDTDQYISLNDRVYYGHRANADAFISLHYDSIEEANSMSGTTTYYYSENEKALADTVNHYLTQNVSINNNGVRRGNYFVLNQNAQPSILLELGYLNNDYDITVVNTQAYQSTVADALYNALNDYFSLR